MNPAAFTLRPYDPVRDFAAACRVHDAARPIELAGACDPRAVVPLAKDDVDLAGFHASDKVVAEDVASGRVIGFVGTDGGCLSWLYVDPAQHGRGVGRALLRHALAALGDDAWTITPAANARAIALYESEGFVVTKTFDGENAGWPVRCVRLERATAEPQPPR